MKRELRIMQALAVAAVLRRGVDSFRVEYGDLLPGLPGGGEDLAAGKGKRAARPPGGLAGAVAALAAVEYGLADLAGVEAIQAEDGWTEELEGLLARVAATVFADPLLPQMVARLCDERIGWAYAEAHELLERLPVHAMPSLMDMLDEYAVPYPAPGPALCLAGAAGGR